MILIESSGTFDVSTQNQRDDRSAPSPTTRQLCGQGAEEPTKKPLTAALWWSLSSLLVLSIRTSVPELAALGGSAAPWRDDPIIDEIYFRNSAEKFKVKWGPTNTHSGMFVYLRKRSAACTLGVVSSHCSTAVLVRLLVHFTAFWCNSHAAAEHTLDLVPPRMSCPPGLVCSCWASCCRFMQQCTIVEFSAKFSSPFSFGICR